MAKTYTPISGAAAGSLIGEGVHTGLRKGSDADDAYDLWKMISDSETTAWSDAIGYALWGLDVMGFAICRVTEEDDS